MAAWCACAASAPTPRSREMGLMTGLNGARADRMPGWGRENSNYGICPDRNPFELRREFLPDLGKRKFRDGSSVSCAFASPQLRQARGKSCPPEGPN